MLALSGMRELAWLMRIAIIGVFLGFWAAGAGAKTVLLERGAEGWRYDDDGAMDEGWRAADFDDAKWASGKAPLGYGDGGLGTEIGFGGDAEAKHLATCFRKAFDVPADVEFERVVLELRCDDGASLTLNGETLATFNLVVEDGAEVTAETVAGRALSGQMELAYRRMELPEGALKAGRNVLAASVHQASPSSSDLVFDLEIVALTAADLPKKAVAKAEARPAIDAYHKRHFVKPEMSIPDGYVDGGTYMKIKEDGTVVATREVIVVDRARDKKLVEHIEFARSKKELPEVERAQVLARYIDELTSPDGNRDLAEAATRKLMDFRNGEMLLGDIPEYCGGGVCRHRSLLFKLMGDEAGLKVGLRRGLVKVKGRIIGRHAWNEITLADGGIRIVDVMNPEEDFELPEPGKVHFNYADMEGEGIYGKPSEPTPEGEGGGS